MLYNIGNVIGWDSYNLVGIIATKWWVLIGKTDLSKRYIKMLLLNNLADAVINVLSTGNFSFSQKI